MQSFILHTVRHEPQKQPQLQISIGSMKTAPARVQSRAGGCYVNPDRIHYQSLLSQWELADFGPGRGQPGPDWYNRISVCLRACMC